MNATVNITGVMLKCLGASDESAIKKIKEKEYNKQYYLKNKEKILKKNKKYCNNHIGNIKKYQKEYREKNKEHLLKYIKLYRHENKEKLNIKKRKYTKSYEKRLEVKIVKRLRTRIRQALKNAKKSKTTLNLTGVDVFQLKKYLESTFKTGMNWEKFKKGLIHIDHIRPCSSFDLSKPEEQAKCFHYTNMQALWAHENLFKGAKYTT